MRWIPVAMVTICIYWRLNWTPYPVHLEQEVEAVLGDAEHTDDSSNSQKRKKVRDPLARLKMAMEYEEKKVVEYIDTTTHYIQLFYLKIFILYSFLNLI